jgi:hypothetical protein
MNRLVLIGAAVAIIGGLSVIFVMRGPDTPVAGNATPSAPTASRIVTKKVDPPTPFRPTTSEAPRKGAPRKTDPAPTAPTAPAAPTLASLKLDSDVPGASVFIDRQFVGNTPLSLDKLTPGTKRLQLTATGFESIQKTIELNPGPNEITIRVKEVTLSARANVVHKHRMGSCEGTLTATLDGLRYDTSNKGDAFTLPYAQIEQFSVDYLDKNLRVKRKGGKTWNFTDKNANADALFVFHRDVESARKKLADGYAKAQ